MLCLWSGQPGLDFWCSNVWVLAWLLSTLISWFICLLSWCKKELEVLHLDRITWMCMNHNRTYGEVCAHVHVKPSVIHYWPFQGGVSVVFYYNCHGHLLGKSCPMAFCSFCIFLCYLNCMCSFPIWYMGQDVVFDCIGSWSLPFHLLCIFKQSWMISIDPKGPENIIYTMVSTRRRFGVTTNAFNTNFSGDQ